MSEGQKSEKDEKQTETHRRAFDSDSFDHLSQYDPDDQFLQSKRSLSIIESILSKHGTSEAFEVLSETSEFDIISSQSSQVMSMISSIYPNQHCPIATIETQEDNYMQDVIAQKIIYYLSLWSDDMRTQLQKLKDSGVMQEKSVLSLGDTIDEADFIIQMDDVDQEFVNLILDTLEVYEFYHMSLMMCKRYRLSARQGKYLTLMCSRYSNLQNIRIEFYKWINHKMYQDQQRQCALLAYEAVHGVLCLLDTQFLKMKSFGEALDETNSLGMQTYRTIFNLGFWKKLVFILQSKMSMLLCMKFFDFRNFRLIMRGFLTHEEKLNNKQLLDIWTVKA